MNKFVISSIKQKTESYLRLSLLTFVLLVLLLSTTLVLFIDQYTKLKYDFIENDNIKVIEIDSKRESGTHIRQLTFEDINTINHILDKNYNGKFLVFEEYKIDFGIVTEQGDSIFIGGLSDGLSEFLHLEINDNTGIVFGNLDQGIYNLTIPVVTCEEAGFTSSQSVKLSFNIEKVDIEENFLINTQIEKIYFGKDTFEKIIHNMFGQSFDDFKKNNEINGYQEIQIIKRLFVKTEDIKQIRDISAILHKQGYNTNYSLSAFHDLESSVIKTILISVFLGIFIFFISCMNIVVAINLYFKQMAKDIGILYHYGYKSEKITTILMRLIDIPLSVFYLVCLIYIILLAYLLNCDFYFITVGIAVGVIALSLLIIRMFTILNIRAICNKNVLELIHNSKVFE